LLARELDGFSLRERHGPELLRDRHGDRAKVRLLVRPEHQIVRLRETEKLRDETFEISKLLNELRYLVETRQRLDVGLEDGKRRAQFMRGIGGELALPPVAALDALERGVDRVDERRDFGGEIVFRQTAVERGGADVAR